MLVKFVIEYIDGTTMSSHDEMYNEIADHAHALPPNNNKLWKSYSIVSDEGHNLKVDFQNGCFYLNGVEIQPGDDEGTVYAFETTPQDFPADDTWKFLNALPYFPVVGRRIFKGDWGESIVYNCGWKRKFGDQTVIRRVFFYPNGKIVMN